MQQLEKQLNLLEKKFGGLQQNIRRNVKSPHEGKYYVTHQGGDRMNCKYHNYSKIYSKYMLEDVNNEINIVEVGILNGIGLAIWCDVFPNANIHGYDIDISIFNNNLNNLKSLNAFKQNNPSIHTFDQFLNNTDYIGNIIKSQKYKIVIDDGCHQTKAILKTFQSFIPHLTEDFIYFIEDNVNVHKIFKKTYPKYNVFYKDQMTVITP